MSTDSGSKFRDAFVAMFAPDMASAATSLVDALIQTPFHYAVDRQADNVGNGAAGSGALANTSHTLDASTLAQFKVTGFKVTAHAAVTSDNSNFTWINLVYNNGAGGSDTVVATVNTATTLGGGTGNLAADQPKAITLVANNNVVVPAGSQLMIKTLKAGTGVSLPILSFDVKGAPV